MDQPEDVVNAARTVIAREAAALHRLAESVDESFVRAVRAMECCAGRIITTGLGKSGMAAAKIAATLSCTGTPASFIHSADALHGDSGAITGTDILLAVSHSGETSEVRTLARMAGMRGAKVIAITGREKSGLGTDADVVLRAAVREEADPLGVIPTCSFVAATAMGDALAISLMRRNGTTYSDFALNHPGGELGRRSRRNHLLNGGGNPAVPHFQNRGEELA